MSDLSRRFAKLCDIRDFSDPELLATIAAILPERDPAAHVERKVWEFAQLALFLRDVGALKDSASALAVGAGDERIVFWLANRMGRVVATDIYGSGEFASNEASASMLTDPASHAPFPYRQDRLEVMEMDARFLSFADESFDVVFSLSSIEHFGSPAEIARSATEMGRVLRPGGYAFVVTECFVRRHPLNAAPVDLAVKLATIGRKRRGSSLRRRSIVDQVFTPRELRKRIVEPSGLELMQPLDLSLSAETWETLANPGGALYPHVLLSLGRSVFTSVALPLRKGP